MKTKTLLLLAAALAAGVIASRAQSNIYSANVVGYATLVYPPDGQYTLLNNPFDDGNGDIMSNIIDSANLLPAKSQILTWDTGTQSFAIIQKTAAGWPSTVNIPPGIGFFIRNGNTGATVPSITNTFVGSVIVDVGQSVTNPIPTGYSLLGTQIPYAGNIAVAGSQGGDESNLDFTLTLPAKSQVLTWNTGVQSYTINQKTAAAWPATTFIQPTDGFFINNKGPATNWVETFNLQ